MTPVVRCVIAIDAGTTGVRSRAVFVDGPGDVATYREFDAALSRSRAGSSTTRPRSGTRVRETLHEVVAQAARRRRASPRSASPTSARRWSRGTAAPASRTARRSSGRTGAPPRAATSSLRPGALPLVRRAHRPRARSVLLRHEVRVAAARPRHPRRRRPGARHDRLVDAVEPDRRRRCTPPTRRTPAARCCSTSARWQWSPELCDLLGRADRRAARRCMPSSGRFGVTVRSLRRARRASRSSGIAGDQQAALFGQACFDAGHGQEHLRHRQLRAAQRRRDVPAAVTEGMLTTVAWTLADGTVAYALEGAIFVTGAAVQWLRDGLGDHRRRRRDRPARRDASPTAAASYLVPAFTGLGSPWWDPYARGTIVGITRGTDARAPRPGGRRVDGVPDPRRGRRDGRGVRARRSRTCASTVARR